jgi:hypothetical protein
MSQGRKWQVLILGLILRAKSIDVLSFKYPLFLIKILSCVKKKKELRKPSQKSPRLIFFPYLTCKAASLIYMESSHCQRECLRLISIPPWSWGGAQKHSCYNPTHQRLQRNSVQ